MMSFLHDNVIPISLTVGAAGIFFILRNVFPSDVAKLEKAVIKKDKEIYQLKEQLKKANEKNKVLEENSYENIINNDVANFETVTEKVHRQNTISISKYKEIFEYFSRLIDSMHKTFDDYFSDSLLNGTVDVLICVFMLVCLFAGPLLYHTFLKKVKIYNKQNIEKVERNLSQHDIVYRFIKNNPYMQTVSIFTKSKLDIFNKHYKRLTLSKISFKKRYF